MAYNNTNYGINANKEIRMAIFEKGLKHYQVAEAMGVTKYTFSTWLQTEMSEEKKAKVLEVIASM